MWTLETDTGTRHIGARDETLRDGGQGEVSRSAARGIAHLIDTCQWFDKATIGWIYTNPADKEIARYLRAHGDAIAARNPHFSTDKFYIFSLVHRGPEKTPGEVDAHTPFGMMLRDLQSGKQPYGTVNVLTKARVRDLSDFGEDVTSETFLCETLNTMRLIKKANPAVKLELGLEHFYTAWLETEGQAANRKHIVDTLVGALLEQNGDIHLSVPDTDGAHTPAEIAQVIGEVTRVLQHDERLTGKNIHFDPALFNVHTHNDLRNGTANVVAGLQAGAGGFDCTVGIMGERAGNGTAAEIAHALKHPEADAITAYQRDLEHSLGIRPGDKALGAAYAFCATGGMHGARLLKGLKAAQQQGHDYDWFASHYEGSYATVPAHRFGRKIQATLSPVAGAANVLFMLAGMGLDIDDKKDPRIAAVLDEVKNGEHERGIHSRGYNNANAFLLLADTFGLRGRNTLKFSFDMHSEGLDAGAMYAGNLGLSTSAAGSSSFHRKYISPHRDNGFFAKGELFSERNFDFYVAQGLIEAAKSDLQKVDARFGDLALLESRRFEAPVGAVHPTNGNPLDPEPENMLVGVKLIFTAGTPEKFQANGVGKTYEEAMGMAIQTLLDYRCFQIERERIKAGESPVLDTSAAIKLEEERIADEQALRDQFPNRRFARARPNDPQTPKR